MRDLNYELKQLGHRHRDGSFATRANRERMLTLIANQLYELGYKKLHATDLKGRHANALVRRWQAEGLAPGTLKNRLAAVRWWADKVGRVVDAARGQRHLWRPGTAVRRHPLQSPGIRRRQAGGHSRSLCPPQPGTATRVRDAPGRGDQAPPGARPTRATAWSYRPPGPKGDGHGRSPFARRRSATCWSAPPSWRGSGALIPPQLSYVQQMRRYERQTAAAGLAKMHGLRHAYAQERYQELTGWAAPSRRRTDQRTVDAGATRAGSGGAAGD